MQNDFYAKKVLPKVPLVLVILMAVGALIGFFVAKATVLRVVALGLVALFLWIARTYLKSYSHPVLLLQVTERGLIFLPEKKDERKVSWEEIASYSLIQTPQRKDTMHAMEVFMKDGASVTISLDRMEGGETLPVLFLKQGIPLKNDHDSTKPEKEEKIQD